MRLLLLFLLALLGLYGLYKWHYPAYSWHQKLTVEVEVDGRLVTGSAVRAVEITFQPQFLPTVLKWEQSYEGEAVVVELPGGRHLFALLAGDGEGRLPTRVFLDALPRKFATPEHFAAVTQLQGARDIPARYMPRLVMFDDINDPASVRLVDPSDLASAFGSGVSLRRMTLEITGEPVTSGRVGALLGPDFFRKWASAHHSALRRGISDPYFKSLTSELNRNSFIEE